MDVAWNGLVSFSSWPWVKPDNGCDDPIAANRCVIKTGPTCDLGPSLCYHVAIQRQHMRLAPILDKESGHPQNMAEVRSLCQ